MKNKSDVDNPNHKSYRIEFAARAISNGQKTRTQKFETCFMMADRDEVVKALLERGLKNPKFRRDLRKCDLIGLDYMVKNICPEYANRYFALEKSDRSEDEAAMRRLGMRHQ